MAWILIAVWPYGHTALNVAGTGKKCNCFISQLTGQACCHLVVTEVDQTGKAGTKPASIFPVSSQSRAGLQTNTTTICHQAVLACSTPHALSAGQAGLRYSSPDFFLSLHLSTLACRLECNVMCDGIQGPDISSLH